MCVVHVKDVCVYGSTFVLSKRVQVEFKSNCETDRLRETNHENGDYHLGQVSDEYYGLPSFPIPWSGPDGHFLWRVSDTCI